MNLSQRRFIGVSVILATVGVGFIVAAFSTDHWINSNPAPISNDTLLPQNRSANITFGLFIGHSSINYGFSPRPNDLKISCDISAQACAFIDKDLHSLSSLINDSKNQTAAGLVWFAQFSLPIYVTTLVMLVLEIISGFLAIGFGIFNVFGRPIETITGPSGLYIWNILAFIFSATAIGTYLGLYFTQLKVNILTDSLTNFTSENCTYLDYSFFFLVGSAVSFILNIVVLCLSGQKCSCNYSLTGEKEVDSAMILY